MGFKAVVTSQGETALELAHELQPSAITLDLRLPDMDGWVVLDRLKHDPATRHIPVHVISVDDSWQRGMRLGAFAFLKKPVSKKTLDDAFASMKGYMERGVKELLIVEDNEIERSSILNAIGDGDVRATAVGTGAEALEALKAGTFDCLVLDLGLPDINGLELLETIKREINPQGLRIIVYTARDLTPGERDRLEEMAESTIVKDVRSLEHLVDKTALFLHRVEANLRPTTRELLHQGQQADPDLAGQKVLIVDDDVRNIFALTSKLERWELIVLRAENGRQALEVLRGTPGIDLVFMDIMMPEMDGYETIRAIREQESFETLPIIALTAKAMKGDRQKCLDAGASDYLAKPVSSEQLLSMLRVWLHRHPEPVQESGETASESEPS
jgi:CheY-like chemotaxis protein